MKAIILSLAVLLIANSANLYCNADAEEVETVKETFSVPASTGHAFLETFQDDPFSRWTESSDSSYDGQKWAHEARKETSDFYATDMGITVVEKAKRYGLSHILDKPVDTLDKDLVVQYEVTLQDGLECGGAYLKFLSANEGLSAKTLSEKSGYSVMFGPDKCGATNKIHLILRHQNPVSKKWEEKHLKKEASIKSDKQTHLYTAILRKDHTFEILVDSESVASGNLKEDMNAFVDGNLKDYNFVPPKEIDDPEDTKPEDWVDEAKIKDPEASKPDDWDEDAPKQILDMEAEMPEGWLEDAPDFVDDPDAEMPEDWDEEEDGEWEAPQIKNPACKAAPGCGEWKRPMIDNPDYKGKWVHPMIDNPDYVGEWNPKQIPNPDYFSEETHPEAFHTLVAPIGGVAIEIWTMSSGIHFDNIYVGNDISAAQEWAAASFGAKDAKEAAIRKAKLASKRAEERLKKFKEGGFSNTINYYLGEVGDVLADNLVATIVTISLGAIGLIYYCCIAGDDDDDVSYGAEQDYDIVEEDTEDEKAEKKTEEKESAKKDDEPKTVEGDAKAVKVSSPKKGKKKKKARKDDN